MILYTLHTMLFITALWNCVAQRFTIRIRKWTSGSKISPPLLAQEYWGREALPQRTNWRRRRRHTSNFVLTGHELRAIRSDVSSIRFTGIWLFMDEITHTAVVVWAAVELLSFNLNATESSVDGQSYWNLCVPLDWSRFRLIKSYNRLC